MARLIGRAWKKRGMAPGSVIYVGKERTAEVQVDVIDYTETELTEKRVASIEECHPLRDSSTISWINLIGVHDAALVGRIGGHFGLHPLIIEDLLNTGQRPKLDETETSICVILKMLYSDASTGELEIEQVTIVFGPTWIITFQETETDVFDAVRQRIRKTVPRVRLMTTDFLAHALIDAVVDHYFVVLEQIGDKIERLDDEISNHPQQRSLNLIRDLKRDLIQIRKAVWPLREVIGALDRSDSKLIHAGTRPYLRDLYEHTVQVIDTVETFRDMVAGLLDLYHTSVANRMNEVMKVLTIFATIFIPLGFLAGVYGMNFDTNASPFNMPELGFRFGYPLFWAIAILVGGGLLLFFRRKKWL